MALALFVANVAIVAGGDERRRRACLTIELHAKETPSSQEYTLTGLTSSVVRCLKIQ